MKTEMLDITKELILTSGMSPKNCPIARALLLKGYYTKVIGSLIKFYKSPDEMPIHTGFIASFNNESAREFVMRFDTAYLSDRLDKFEPCTVIVKIPDGVEPDENRT